MSQLRSWPDDTRGIVDPGRMKQLVDFARYPAGPELEGLIDWFWSVSWSLPDGVVHNQEVLNHPSGHISIGTVDDSGVPLDPARGRVYGVLTGISQRTLMGSGWTVAAKTTVGGLGVLIDQPARHIVDTELDLAAAVPGLDGSGLVADVIAIGEPAERVDRLRASLTRLVAERDPGRVAEARRVADVAAVAERDRSVCRVEQLAEVANVSVRTLQRLFDVHVGVSPSWVIRRWRVIEAAEAAVTQGEWSDWAGLSDRLGYADQAHLIRDFQRHLGTTPGRYLARNRAGDRS